MASAAVGGLALLGVSKDVRADGPAPVVRPSSNVAAVGSGSIHGVVQDENGAPVVGALVSALGATTAYAVTDRSGRFELRTLSPGAYLLRAHSSGFVASHGQMIDVRPSSRTSSSIGLKRTTSSAASPVGLPPAIAPITVPKANGDSPDPPGWHRTSGCRSERRRGRTGSQAGGSGRRSRDRRRRQRVAEQRRSQRDRLASSSSAAKRACRRPQARCSIPTTRPCPSRTASVRRRDSPARTALPFDWPRISSRARRFSGELNFLTTSSFDTPQQLFNGDMFARNVAYMSVGAPAGSNAEWAVRGALSQADISAWVIAGTYSSHGPGPASLRSRSFVRDAALRRRQSGGVARRHGRQPECRRHVRVRHVDPLSGARGHLRRPVCSLRLPRKQRSHQPARFHDAVCGRPFPRHHVGVTAIDCSWRRGVSAAGRVRDLAAASAHLLFFH